MIQKFIIALFLSFSITAFADDARTTYIASGAPSFVAPRGSHCRDSSSAAEYVNISGTNTWSQIVSGSGTALTSGTFSGINLVGAVLTSPTITGLTSLSGTLSGALTSTGTLTGPTIISPILGGTSSGNIVRTGTITGGTVVSPVYSGTATGTLTLAGTNGFVLLDGTGAGAVLGTQAVSGSNSVFFDGTVWRQLNN